MQTPDDQEQQTILHQYKACTANSKYRVIEFKCIKDSSIWSSNFGRRLLEQRQSLLNALHFAYEECYKIATHQHYSCDAAKGGQNKKANYLLFSVEYYWQLARRIINFKFIDFI